MRAASVSIMMLGFPKEKKTKQFAADRMIHDASVAQCAANKRLRGCRG